MLKLIIGDDHTNISNFLKSVKSSYSPNAIREFSGNEFRPADIIDATQSTDMFSSQSLVIAIPAKADQVDFSEDFLSSLKNNKEVELVIIATKLNKLTKIYKSLDKYSDIKKQFSLKKDYSNFDMADALFVYGNKKAAITKLNLMDNIDTEFVLIISALYSGLRNRISVEQKNQTASKLPPFIKNKYTRSPNTHGMDYPRIYRELLNLDISLKSLPGDKKSRIIDFMLYSI